MTDCILLFHLPHLLRRDGRNGFSIVPRGWGHRENAFIDKESSQAYDDYDDGDYDAGRNALLH